MKITLPIKPNSFKNTFCVFKEVPLIEIENIKSNFISSSGSTYYYTELGMYRLSNHWGRLANSKWRLESLEIENQSKTKLGFALWEDFYPDNSKEELYYITTDFKTKTVNYQHKNNPLYDNKAVLRNSFETTKKIKQIRNLLNLTSWAKHFEYYDLEVLQEKIITDLMFTNKPLEEIKRDLR
ncbi:hypothetical protein [Flavobacterium luteum]|uniref:Uncharacterized protein n=1 Tax=Flavobacterium luteum TaxID=2026654 RepID=A0A7J5AL23_9FLAO|nr:hypothetical protein [Flavobacterium luteum]KAB1158190.1 hypothetical protein F6464_03660 [Flavobacterium luteum]